MGAASNIFGFSSAATTDLKDPKTLTAGGVGLLPGLLVGAGVLVGLLCMSAFFYALHTRRRSKLNLLYTAIGGALLLSVLSWRTGCSIERASIYFIIMIIIDYSHRWHISEEERVSFSPSRQGGSEEEVRRN